MQALSSVRANAGQRVVIKAQTVRASRQCLTVEARQVRGGVGLMGTKAGMTTIFQEDGVAVPCTVIALESSNYVTQRFTKAEHGYDAIQVGYKVVKEKNIKKPERGHCTKAGTPLLRHLKEFKVSNADQLDGYDVGKEIDMTDLFTPGDVVDCSGMTIGKGFQGNIKRWGHHRGLMTHGSKSHRQHGSIGMCATPARVLPNLKHAGHMGYDRVTIKMLPVLLVDTKRQAIVVKGSIPGKRGNLIEITPAKYVGNKRRELAPAAALAYKGAPSEETLEDVAEGPTEESRTALAEEVAAAEAEASS